MTTKGRATACALALAGALSVTVAPTIVAAQQAAPPPQAAPAPGGHRDRVWDALQAANLRPDQQAHIQQLMASARARIRGESDHAARRADKKQLRRDIMATLDPGQREAFKSALRQMKAERKAEKAGAAPPQQ